MKRGGWMAAGALFILAAAGCGSPGKMFLEAQKLDSGGKWQEAVKAYRAMADKYPKASEAIKALFRAGEICEEKLGDARAAVEAYRPLKAIADGKPEAGEAMLRLGRALESSGSPYKESLENYAAVRKQFAGKQEGALAMLATGRLLEVMQSWTQAKAVYEEATRTIPDSPEKSTAWSRLQSVWLLESLGLYFSGKIPDGVKMAGEALARPIAVPEVKRGLEVLLRRHALARKFQESQPSQVQVEEVSNSDALDASRFIIQAKAGEIQPAPEGWDFKYDAKKRKFALKDNRPASRGKPGEKRKSWTFTSDSDYEIMGCWWSMDRNYLGWAARERGGSRRVLEVLDLGSHRVWRVTSSPGAGAVGEVMIFLPSSRKLVFPFRRYIVVSDIRGGSQSLLKMRIPGPGPSFRGGDAKWLSASADGLEVAAGIASEKKPDRKKSAKKGEAAREDQAKAADNAEIWKVNLTLLGME